MPLTPLCFSDSSDCSDNSDLSDYSDYSDYSDLSDNSDYSDRFSSLSPFWGELERGLSYPLIKFCGFVVYSEDSLLEAYAEVGISRVLIPGTNLDALCFEAQSDEQADVYFGTLQDFVAVDESVESRHVLLYGVAQLRPVLQGG